jgi:hypothetical protein
MTEDRSPVLLVLDTSAILAYTRGSVHVGEPLSEVRDEGGVVALPVLCLAAARWMVEDGDRLNLLVGHPGTEVMAVPEDWLAMARMGDTVADQDAASAAYSAIDLDCDVLTARPGLYRGLPGGGPVIGIP